MLNAQTIRQTAYALLLVLSLTTPAYADIEAGRDAYDRGDYATALREWRPFAEQGDAYAQTGLGSLYDDGKGVPQDYDQARQWYEKAAAHGDALAEASLGRLYLLGKGVPQDYPKALFWLRRAADQGEEGAQGQLGLMYHSGWGVTQDYVEAHKWYNLSAANGLKEGTILRDDLTKRMTPAQIAEAQKLAREWKPKQY